MQALIIQATKSTPSVNFDPTTNILSMKGESYPENAAKFFGPIFLWLEEFLASQDVVQAVVEIELIYFNSSSSKALMNFFELLDNAVSDGRQIEVNWRYQKENETALEAGEEYRDEVRSLVFNLVET